MRQESPTLKSKIFDGLLTGVALLGFAAVGAVGAIIFWQALLPYRMLVADLWNLIPAGARAEAGIGLAIAGGALLTFLILVGTFSKDEPGRYSGTARSGYAGFDEDGAVEMDIDVSDM
ncbi:hypothetical protein [Actinoplanes regularis]|uniref:hypothetical protein n=1 Tax=Actinoplanes regularis TaxID=52697 RepID=UPI0025533D6A|nr:hypothetical protein [Actinoplanes regularis]GLW27776.1 hypothetical protein Areg01_07160 [Actinoplanes regularis]